MSRITIVSTERSFAIMVENYKYLKHKVYTNSNILWRCSEREKKCPSTVVTDTEIKNIVRISSSHNHDDLGEREIDKECEQRENFTGWAIKTYSGGFKTKTVTKEKYRRIVDTIKGEIRNSAENSKFRFWMRSKGFRLVGDQLFVLSTGGFDYKKVAVVEDFFDIIYSVHVEKGAKNGYHAGQKRTYRAVTERYAFLPREAVTKFLLGCAECQKRHDPDSTPVSSRHAHVQDYLPINLTTRNCVITLSAPDFRPSAHPTGTEWENWSSPKKRRLEDSSGSEIISPISTDEEIPPVLLKQEMRVSPEIDVQEEINGKNGSEMKAETEEAWNFGVKKSSTPQRELSSPLQETSSVHDETSSSGNKDDDDDDDDDDLKAPHHDSERLKAFNMFVRLFVDENLDRCVPISKQPKEKVQAIIDSCTRQFPEYGERARKRIRTYLKSCRRNKRSRDSTSWPEPGRPTPAHLTSVQAEQILAAACENESHNAKRMRLGLEPVSQPMPSFAESRPQIVDFGPANLVENKANNNNNNNNNKPGSPNYTKPELQSKSINTTNVGSLNQGFPGLAQYRSLYMNQNQFASPLLTGFHTSSSSPEDLSVRGPSSAAAQTRNFLAQKLSPAEISAVRQLIAGYRESAAFLLRSADELQALLGHHQI